MFQAEIPQLLGTTLKNWSVQGDLVTPDFCTPASNIQVKRNFVVRSQSRDSASLPIV
jgi:hypothetical protein